MKVRFINAGCSGDNTPKIELIGAWLHDQGFTVGARIAVCHKEHGRILLINTDIESYRHLEEEFCEQVLILEA